MRRYAFPFSVILLFFIMLSFPQEVFDGASEGLLLWFQIVLPACQEIRLFEGVPL